jgi:nucleoside-diphosphate-sugar epimerase
VTKVIILGGNGFVGSALSREASKRYSDLIIVDRNSYSVSIGMDCDILINASTNSKKYISSQFPDLDFQETVENVKNSLKNFTYKKYVLISSADVYSDSPSPNSSNENREIDTAKIGKYGFHKYLAEKCVMKNANDWIVFRMGGFVGEGIKKNAIYDILFGKKLWIAPNSKLQFINTDIAAQIVFNILDLKISNQIFNLCGIGCVELQEIIDYIGRSVRIDNNAKYIAHEISLDKISRYARLPKSKKMVFDYIDEIIKVSKNDI